jgi:hypothetical protein
MFEAAFSVERSVSLSISRRLSRPTWLSGGASTSATWPILGIVQERPVRVTLGFFSAAHDQARVVAGLSEAGRVGLPAARRRATAEVTSTAVTRTR